MHDSSLSALQRMRPTLRKRWEALLRAEPVNSPLGTPEALVHLMDWTLDRVFAAVSNVQTRRRGKGRSSSTSFDQVAELCECGLNPLLAYFATAARALMQCIFLAESPLPNMTPDQRQSFASEMQQALHTVARSEISTLCSLCQRKTCAQVRATEQPVSAG